MEQENEHEDREIAAAALLRAAERAIDDAFEGGYAIRNPTLVGTVFNALMTDYTKVREMHVMVALANRNTGIAALSSLSTESPQ